MLPQTTGEGIVRMPVEYIAGHRQLLRSCSGEGKDTPESVLLNEKIANGEPQLMLRQNASILEAILRVQVAGKGATMSLEVVRSDHHLRPYMQPKRQMSTI